MQTWDVIVVGGGSGGFGAAYAAARAGARVLLIEQYPWLGGTSTSGGVNTWEASVGGTGIPFDLYLHMKKKGRPDAVGIYSQGRHFCDQSPFCWPHNLPACNFPGGESIIDPTRHYVDTLRRHPDPEATDPRAFQREHIHGVTFEPEAMHSSMMALLNETSHADVRLETKVVSLAVKAGHIESAVLDTGEQVAAPIWIDGTGNALLCRMAGCEQLLGEDSRDAFDEASAAEVSFMRLNGITRIYRVTPTPTSGVEALPPDIPVDCWWATHYPCTCVNAYPNGDRNMNMLPTMDGAAFMAMPPEEALVETERRVRGHWHFIQTNFPEFQAFRLQWIAPMIGVREGPRTICERMLTENDLLGTLHKQTDPDIIAISDHPTDRHGAGGRCGEMKAPYGIPYRCLLPRDVDNLLVASRGAGFSSIAASSCRLSRIMMQLGQAAGTAAALASEKACAIRDIDSKELRNRLAAQHVQLAWPIEDAVKAWIIKQDS